MPLSIPGDNGEAPLARPGHALAKRMRLPSDHGALPDIVANGRKPGVFACGFCHRATGPGGPENADLAGLPKSYIIQQDGRLQEWRAWYGPPGANSAKANDRTF
jgi:cytochrome c553